LEISTPFRPYKIIYPKKKKKKKKKQGKRFCLAWPTDEEQQGSGMNGRSEQ
jgi:hypothetical protein